MQFPVHQRKTHKTRYPNQINLSTCLPSKGFEARAVLYHGDKTNNFGDGEHVDRAWHSRATLYIWRPWGSLCCIHSRTRICTGYMWSAYSRPEPGRIGICISDNQCHSILDASPHPPPERPDRWLPSTRRIFRTTSLRVAFPTFRMQNEMKNERMVLWW